MTDVNNQSLESQALSAIYEEVLKLLAKSLPQDIEHGVSLIESICRHKHDIRTEQEKGT